MTNSSPDARFTYSPDSPSPDETVTFDASDSSDPDGEIVDYDWYIDGDYEPGGETFDHSFDTGGDYEVKLVVTDENGSTSSATKTVTVENTPPDPDYSYSPDVPSPDETVTFDGSKSSDPDGEIVDYDWYIDGDYEPDGETLTHSFDTGGDYEVKLTVTDNGEVSRSITKTITVENTPPEPDYSYSPDIPSPDESVTFDGGESSDPDGEIVDYDWYIDDDYEPDGETLTHSFDTGGDYEVKLTVTDNGEVSRSITKTITVENTPPEPDYSYSPDPPSPDESVTFDGGESSDPDGEIVDYDWYIDGDYEPDGETLNHAFDTAGDYEVKLTVTDNGEVSRSVTKTVTVENTPPRPIFDNPADPNPGRTITFDASPSNDPDGEIVDYDWYIDGDYEPGGETLDHEFSTAGEYNVTLKVTDNGEVTRSTSKTITVANEPPEADITVSPETPVPDQTVALDARSSRDPDGEISQYEWYREGAKIGQGAMLNTTFDVNGTYTVSVVVVDDGGKRSESSRTITVTNDAPNPEFSVEDEPLLVDAPVLFDAANSSDTDGEIVEYSWRVDGNAVGEGEQITKSFSSSGTYEVVLEVTDNGRLQSTATREIYVTAPPKPETEIGPEPIATGRQIVFDASSSTDPDGNVAFYEWTFDEAETERGARVEHSFGTPGTHNVSVRLVDNHGATVIQNRTITVYPSPNASLNLNRTTLNRGEPIAFDASAELEEVEFAWDFTGDGKLDTEQRSGTRRFSEVGTRTVGLTVTSETGVTERLNRTVEVSPALTTTATVSQAELAPQNRTNVTYTIRNHRSVPATANITLAENSGVTVWQVDGARLASSSSLSPIEVPAESDYQVTVEYTMEDAGEYELGGEVAYQYPDGVDFEDPLAAGDVRAARPSQTTPTATPASTTSADGPGFSGIMSIVAIIMVVLLRAWATRR